MSHYELLIILPGKLSETDLPTAAEAVRSLCAQGGLTITREEMLGKKKLAYDIKGEQYGYYYLLECDGEQERVNEFSSRVHRSPEILRHAVYEKPVKSQETLQKETQLRERVAQRRAARAAKEVPVAAPTAPIIPAAPKAAPAAAPVAVDIAALDKKLEELLQAPEKV